MQQRKPLALDLNHRHHGRRALLSALQHEYRFGDSISKMYVTLLARNMVKLEPKLKDKCVYFLEQCGIKVDETIID